ncbi:hypothetical protein [Kutzneria chonburiensis]|uniref:Uncharacterized protein n=1 Tax=Kutzneria chonburiensis TaxID=1483604 RepID=A0ABV6MZ82_9PSEU|nr:hypothetical protein [Kutzneria chonburiensis]
MDDRDFVLTIHEVFTIPGRGTVVVGTVESGVLRGGQTVGVWAGDHLIATTPAWFELIWRPDHPRRLSLLLSDVDRGVVGVGHIVRRSAG